MARIANVLLISAVAILLAQAACDSSGSDQGSVGQSLPPGSDRVVHVHGLGINPKDGALYAATHTGLFLINGDGTAARVSDRFQDTMGFTVAGPDQFFGSGHPDLRDYNSGKLPPLLGLIASDNAGRTWNSVSLRGKADFYALEMAHGSIYGFDATSESFMVSQNDGKNWETKSKLGMFDFAVSPDSPDVVIGATATGLMQSVDGGKSWQRLGEPAPVLLGWQDRARLWGLDKNGAVYLSRDSGRSWQVQGTLPGFPEAFLDTGSRLFAAVREAGIYSSADDGKTWSMFYRDPFE